MLALSLWGIPADVWLSSLLSLLAGGLIIWVSKWKSVAKRELWKEIVRDIGIAFLVAAIVSMVYEWSTRSAAEHEKMSCVLTTLMSSYVTEAVWNEVNAGVFKKTVRRENAEVKLRLQRQGVLPNGQTITLPEHQAVLWMEYSYDLYGMATGSPRLEVQHSVDYYMWNEQMNMPRFERVVIIKHFPKEEEIRYEGVGLQKIDKGRGTIRLAGETGIDLPPPEKQSPVRIITERYEIVNLPGFHGIILPELTTGTIKVSIEGTLPDGIEPIVSTGRSEHDFKRPDNNQYNWIFDGTMLPGQTILLIFQNKGL